MHQKHNVQQESWRLLFELDILFKVHLFSVDNETLTLQIIHCDCIESETSTTTKKRASQNNRKNKKTKCIIFLTLGKTGSGVMFSAFTLLIADRNWNTSEAIRISLIMKLLTEVRMSNKALQTNTLFWFSFACVSKQVISKI